MAKYINADELIVHLEIASNYRGYQIKHALQDVKDFPAADVRENVRGEWEWRYDDENGRPVYGCSFCNEMIVDAKNKEYVFCPYCGADNHPTTTSADMRQQYVNNL